MTEIKQWIIENFFTLISTLFGGGSFVGYVLERKKRRIQEKQETTDALKSMQEAYDKFTQDLLRRYDELSKEVVELKAKLSEVTAQLGQERDKYQKLDRVYNELMTKLKNK